jgi:hypothetical protein
MRAGPAGGTRDCRTGVPAADSPPSRRRQRSRHVPQTGHWFQDHAPGPRDASDPGLCRVWWAGQKKRTRNVSEWLPFGPV